MSRTVYVCSPREAAAENNPQFIKTDAGGRPIYLEDVMEIFRLKQQQSKQPDLPLAPRPSLLPSPPLPSPPRFPPPPPPHPPVTSTMGLPKCPWGLQCKIPRDHFHATTFRHPCKDYAECTYIKHPLHGTSEERGKHFKAWGHPCAMGSKCLRPKIGFGSGNHWMTHEHISTGVEHPPAGQKKKECPLQGRCICVVDRAWNHEHFASYTHNYWSRPKIVPVQGSSAARDVERILSTLA